MTYTFNSRMMSMLAESYGEGKLNFLRRVNICLNSWNKFLRDGSIPVLRFIGMCNELRLPTKYIIQPADTLSIVYPYEDVVMREEEFQTISFNFHTLNRTCSKMGATKQNATQIAHEVGLKSCTSVKQWMDPEKSTLTVAYLIKLCNAYDLDIYTMLQDVNSQYAAPAKRKTVSKKQPTIVSLAKENKELRKCLKELADRVAVLETICGKFAGGNDLQLVADNPYAPYGNDNPLS